MDIYPVCLGSDANVYGMARSFFMAYGVKTACVCKSRLSATKNTRLIAETIVEPELENDEVFVRTLLDFSEKHTGRTLLLISCADGYSILLARHREILKDRFLFSSSPLPIVRMINFKESFYETCKKYGLDYPETVCCTPENYRDIRIPFPYPCIVKPADSAAYWNCHFPNKKKVFLAHDHKELMEIIAAIYGSSYQDTLILQEYIPGDDSYCRSVNCYCGQDGKVRLLSVGRPLLEEQTPEGAGNFSAILSVTDEKITQEVRAFLEAIRWTGFCNLDLKIDERTGIHKYFEMNPRQGKSSFYVTAFGYNLAEFLVEDLVLHKSRKFTVTKTEHLWLMSSFGLLKKYTADRKLLTYAEKLRRDGKMTRHLICKEDLNIPRLLWYIRHQLNYCRMVALYQKKGWTNK